jgi:ribosome-associated protein
MFGKVSDRCREGLGRRPSPNNQRGGLPLEPIELARRIVDVVEDKLGEDILLLDIRELCLFADFFVICNGTSERQLKALVESVHQTVKQELGILPHHMEGEAVSGWILMDYSDVIVHIFAPELRAYYDLEGLWQEGKVLLRMQ